MKNEKWQGNLGLVCIIRLSSRGGGVTGAQPDWHRSLLAEIAARSDECPPGTRLVLIWVSVGLGWVGLG